MGVTLDSPHVLRNGHGVLPPTIEDVVGYVKQAQPGDLRQLSAALVQRYGATNVGAALAVSNEVTNVSDLLGGIRTGAWLNAQQFPPVSYAIAGVLPEGFCLLCGAPKIGKSWLVLNFALAAASGGYALGRIPVERRPVLYAALEDSDRRMQDRCVKLLAGMEIPPDFRYVTSLQPALVNDTISAWVESIEGSPLVILDTLGKVMPPSANGESTYSRDYRIGAQLKRIADERPGMTLLVNHHDRKANAEDFIDAVSGTHGLAGAADTVIILDRKRHEATGNLKVTGRDVEEGEYSLKFDAGAWVLNGATLAEAAQRANSERQVSGVGARMADVIALCGQYPGGVDAAFVAEKLGIEANQARVYLYRAKEAGRLDSPKRGIYTPITPVICVTSVMSDDDSEVFGVDGGADGVMSGDELSFGETL